MQDNLGTRPNDTQRTATRKSGDPSARRARAALAWRYPTNIPVVQRIKSPPRPGRANAASTVSDAGTKTALTVCSRNDFIGPEATSSAIGATPETATSWLKPVALTPPSDVCRRTLLGDETPIPEFTSSWDTSDPPEAGCCSNRRGGTVKTSARFPITTPHDRSGAHHREAEEGGDVGWHSSERDTNGANGNHVLNRGDDVGNRCRGDVGSFAITPGNTATADAAFATAFRTGAVVCKTTRGSTAFGAAAVDLGVTTVVGGRASPPTNAIRLRPDRRRAWW